MRSDEADEQLVTNWGKVKFYDGTWSSNRKDTLSLSLDMLLADDDGTANHSLNTPQCE